MTDSSIINFLITGSTFIKYELEPPSRSRIHLWYVPDDTTHSSQSGSFYWSVPELLSLTPTPHDNEKRTSTSIASLPAAFTHAPHSSRCLPLRQLADLYVGKQAPELMQPCAAAA